MWGMSCFSLYRKKKVLKAQHKVLKRGQTIQVVSSLSHQQQHTEIFMSEDKKGIEKIFKAFSFQEKSIHPSCLFYISPTTTNSHFI